MDFVGKAGQREVTITLDREACVIFGWFALFLNLRSDYHWYGGPIAELRAEALRDRLLEKRRDLAELENP